MNKNVASVGSWLPINVTSVMSPCVAVSVVVLRIPSQSIGNLVHYLRKGVRTNELLQSVGRQTLSWKTTKKASLPWMWSYHRCPSSASGFLVDLCDRKGYKGSTPSLILPSSTSWKSSPGDIPSHRITFALWCDKQRCLSACISGKKINH